VAFAHFPPVDERGAERLRAATVAWAPLLGELHAVGLRPYLELEHGSHDDELRLYCEVDGDLLLDASICDEGSRTRRRQRSRRTGRRSCRAPMGLSAISPM
jgi:hypothetical protein